jgi:hypothetical protein
MAKTYQRNRPGESPSTAFEEEELEELLEGIGPPLEEALHVIDPLRDALLDESDMPDDGDFDQDELEAEIDREAEREG